jgi:hypothetical protein
MPREMRLVTLDDIHCNSMLQPLQPPGRVAPEIKSTLLSAHIDKLPQTLGSQQPPAILSECIPRSSCQQQRCCFAHMQLLHRNISDKATSHLVCICPHQVPKVPCGIGILPLRVRHDTDGIPAEPIARVVHIVHSELLNGNVTVISPQRLQASPAGKAARIDACNKGRCLRRS